jgi:hypothetical protein
MQTITITIRAKGEHVDPDNEAQAELIAYRIRQGLDRMSDLDLITLEEIEIEVTA